MSDVEGREDLIEHRRIVNLPMHIIAYRSMRSNALVEACSGRVFFSNNNSREDLTRKRVTLAFNSALKAILQGIQLSVCLGKLSMILNACSEYAHRTARYIP